MISLQIQAHNAILRRHGEGFETSPAPNRNGSYEDHVMATKALPSPEVLRQLLRYEPETGKLFWLPRPVEMFAASGVGGAAGEAARWNACRAGREAFTTSDQDGYRTGLVLGRRYRAHRVIWAMQTGEWPANEVDHADRNTANNRWVNLRAADRSDQEANKGLRSDNTSGFKGVSWSSRAGKWAAQLKFRGVCYRLGHHVTAEAAAAQQREAGLTDAVERLVVVLDRNDKKGPIPDVEMMFCWLAAQDIRAAFRAALSHNGRKGE